MDSSLLPSFALALGRRRVAAGAVLAATAATCLACGAPESERPNVLLVTLDTLRADRLSAYGYELPTSPFLEELAARGVRFDRAYASSNVTKPSHASILTGLHPKHHGLITNNEAILHDDIETLAERFAGHGYSTAAVVASNLLDADRSGLGQGFARYLDLASAGRRPAGSRFRLVQRSAAEVVEHALLALTAPPSEPFFAWLHFYDPHTPYRPPPEYFDRFWELRERVEPPAPLAITAFGGERMAPGTIPRASALAGARDPRVYEAAYLGEIAFLDDQLRRLFAAFGELDLARPLLVAITADHGEMLGERGIYYHHPSLEEPVIRVPLILLGPGVPAGSRVAALVESVDLAPTLAELAGLSAAPPGDGRSLVPLLREAAQPAGEAFSQHSHDLAISLRDCAGTLMLPLPSAADTVVTPFTSFSRRTYLAYLGLEAPRFEPREDPPATEACQGDDLGERRQRLLAWYRERREYPPPRTDRLDDRETEELRALGYL